VKWIKKGIVYADLINLVWLLLILLHT